MKCKNILLACGCIISFLPDIYPIEENVNIFCRVNEHKNMYPNEKFWVVFALKIQEGDELYYYLFPYSLARNMPFNETFDLMTSVKFSQMEDMISYINANNQYNVFVWNGFNFVSKGSFKAGRIPMEFTSEEKHKIKTRITNWVK